MNYTGLRRGDSDYEGYISKGDINMNDLIDAYDISVVATQLEGGITRKDTVKVSGSLSISTPKRQYLKDEIVEIRVKLLTDGDQDPVKTAFTFEILPPWYRTWWSYLMYLIVVMSLFYYMYYHISESRRRLLVQKESELYQQEQKFQKESDLKDKKIDILKEENLQSELRHKSEELIRTTLNIVRKNETLLNIKKVSENRIIGNHCRNPYWNVCIPVSEIAA